MDARTASPVSRNQINVVTSSCFGDWRVKGTSPRGRLEIHVAILIFIQLQELLIRIESGRHLPESLS